MIKMVEKKYFKKMLFIVGFAFAATCFSIIFCVIKANTVNESQSSSHVMSIVFMFLQLIMEAIVFYYSFKAMVNGSSLIKNVMLIEDGTPNVKCKRNALIFGIVSLILSIYMILVLIIPNIFLSFFALGLKFALANFLALVAIIAFYFYFYPKEKNK